MNDLRKKVVTIEKDGQKKKILISQHQHLDMQLIVIALVQWCHLSHVQGDHQVRKKNIYLLRFILLNSSNLRISFLIKLNDEELFSLSIKLSNLCNYRAPRSTG